MRRPNYWRRRKTRRLQKHWHRQKYWYRQKKKAPAKTRHWWKHRRRQNVGAVRKVGAGAENFLTVRLGRIRSCWLLLGPADGLLLLPMVMLLSVHAVVKWSIASLCPTFMGGLSPVLYRLVVPARHAENGPNLGAYQNIGACLKFTGFCQTIAVYISAHRRPIKK
jgi:hypothetical protein